MTSQQWRAGWEAVKVEEPFNLRLDKRMEEAKQPHEATEPIQPFKERLRIPTQGWRVHRPHARLHTLPRPIHSDIGHGAAPKVTLHHLHILGAKMEKLYFIVLTLSSSSSQMPPVCDDEWTYWLVSSCKLCPILLWFSTLCAPPILSLRLFCTRRCM